MDLTLIAQLLVYGLVLGAAYGLMAIGLTLVFGVLNILNAAQGTFYMIGAYVTYIGVVVLGFPYPLALLLGVLGGGLTGILCERITVRPILAEPEAVLISTFAFAILLESVARLLTGNVPFEVPAAPVERITTLGGIVINHQRILVFVVSIALFVVVDLFLRYSRMGLGIRAVAKDRDMAALMGIPVQRIYTFTFLLAALLAGIAGALLSPLFGVEPTAWEYVLVKAFVVVILGGLGSVYGAMAGGLLLGVAESFGAAISSGFKEGIGFGILILCLLYRPQGLLGRSHGH